MIQFLSVLLIILLFADVGGMIFNAYSAMGAKDQFWFIFCCLSIGLLILAGFIFIWGVIK